MKTNHFVATLVGSASTFVLATTVFAQSVGSGAEELDEIVVTGSRVITNGNNSPTPVTVVDAQNLLSVNPSTISEALNVLPVFSGSNGQTSNPNVGIGAGGGGNGARAALNLRNLGEARTLVLMDGHRVPSTTSTNVVDSDMIPQLMIERVDVVTGGVSAVYGSDAIAGVINFVTDRDFNGVKTEAKYGISDENDGEQYSFGIAAGTKLGERAHIEASYEYRNDEGIKFRSSRPNNHLCGMPGNGNSIPYYLACGLRRYDATFGGLIRAGTALGNTQFLAGGTTAAFNPGQTGAVTGSANIAIGGDGAYLDGSLRASLESHQLFTRFDYDFTDALHGYVEAAYNKKENGFYANWLNIGTNARISRDNAFLPANVRDAYVAANQTTFQFGKFVNSQDTRIHPEVESEQIFVMTGLEGKLGDYSWEIGYVRGDATLDDVHNNNVNNYRLSAALDAVRQDPNNPNSPIVCRVSLTPSTAALFPNCVPINVFGPGSESAAALDYVLDNTTYVAKTVQDEFSGSISGKPFNTWAGPFAAALSAEWRKQSFSSVSGMPPANPSAPINCVSMGLRFNCAGTTSEFGTTFANRSKVSQTVQEGAFEFDAPLVTGMPAIQALNLNGAVRYTSYDTSGEYTTWKVGIDWNVNDSWRIRGTSSEDIRAPTLNDLFAPAVGTPQNITDDLLNVQSQAPRFEYGNSNLVAEVGNTMTLGVVFRPESLPGFSVSLDWYDIEITDAIISLAGTDRRLQSNCYANPTTSPYCSLQTRALGSYTSTDPANVVTQWATTVFNVAKVHTTGFDMELNYSTRIGTHPLELRGMFTYQPHIEYERPFLPTVDHGGASYDFGGLQAAPSQRATVLIRYGVTEALSADLQTRWRNSMSMIGDDSLATRGDRVPSFWTSNLNLNYRLQVAGGDLDMFLNVQNLFDKKPPPANFYGTLGNTGQYGGWATSDDIVGRFYTAGVRYKF